MTIEVMLAAGCTPTEICALWRWTARRRVAHLDACREAVIEAEAVVTSARHAQRRLRYAAHLVETGRCSEYGMSAYLRAA